MILELYKFFLVIAELRQQFNTNKQNWKPCKMQLINIIQSNKFRFKKENPNLNSRGISGLSSVVRFVPFGSSSRSSAEKASFLRSTGTTLHKKKEQLRKRAALFFALLRSSSSHTLYPAFVGATTSTIPLHYVPLRKLRCTSFSRIVSVAPCVLAVALPPAINLNRNANADFIDLFR